MGVRVRRNVRGSRSMRESRGESVSGERTRNQPEKGVDEGKGSN